MSQETIKGDSSARSGNTGAPDMVPAAEPRCDLAPNCMCFDKHGAQLGPCIRQINCDCSLLENAAIAIGQQLTYRRGLGFILGDTEQTGWRWWNPLTDDGDALRLAVKLGLFFKPEVFHFLSLARFAGQDRDDSYAYRRAIVRAAAEIGRTM